LYGNAAAAHHSALGSAYAAGSLYSGIEAAAAATHHHRPYFPPEYLASYTRSLSTYYPDYAASQYIAGEFRRKAS